ncbi:MAG: deoxyribose-phosphate aldolase [Candidatus Neomarinimicrobiota bacterium]|nr:MAG: deoxyribose-phosphate aldolase [Candidatus Neomarinimicrobiota bacterium]
MNTSWTIALGADHGGYALKEELKQALQDHQLIDCGTFDTQPVDYPVFAEAVARKVASGEADFGIMIDGAGIGSAMVANKVPGVRAALCYDVSTARNAREHNDARVLTLGAGLVGPALARQIVDTFLSTACTVDRHLRRVSMIDQLDTKAPIQASVTTAPSPESHLSDQDLQQIADQVTRLLENEPRPEGETGDHCTSDMVCRCGICVEKEPDTFRRFMDFGVERIGFHDGTGCQEVPEDIARCIDHTLLKPDATEADIRRICREALENRFASVCISPSYVKLAARELSGSDVDVCTVIGFPSGAHTPEIKALETRQAIREGAREIDMVINIGALKSGRDDLVYRDIRGVVEACEDGGAICKVIIEAALLTDEEKVRACEAAKKARAHFVKTSTGFGPGGATVEDVALMKSVVGRDGLQVKAAGGIKSYADARKMVEAGASRIGASAGIAIVKQAKEVTVSQ